MSLNSVLVFSHRRVRLSHLFERNFSCIQGFRLNLQICAFSLIWSLHCRGLLPKDERIHHNQQIYSQFPFFCSFHLSLNFLKICHRLLPHPFLQLHIPILHLLPQQISSSPSRYQPLLYPVHPQHSHLIDHLHHQRNPLHSLLILHPHLPLLHQIFV